MVRHANAGRLEVRLASDARGARMLVIDDGDGFEPRRRRRPRAAGGGMGLGSMRERARALGGRVRVRSTPGHGTMVDVRLPRPAEPPSAAPAGPDGGGP